MGKWGCAEIAAAALPAEKVSPASSQIIPSATPKNVYCNDLMGLIGSVKRGVTASRLGSKLSDVSPPPFYSSSHPRVQPSAGSRIPFAQNDAMVAQGCRFTTRPPVLFYEVENPPARSVSEIRPITVLLYRWRLVVGS